MRRRRQQRDGHLRRLHRRPDVRLIGVEAGGRGITPGEHAARFAGGSAGVLQGTRSYVLQDADGNVELTHSISAGLDYASVGPEHAWLREIGRAEYTWIDDEAALAAFQRLGREEGILPALESSHAIAHACRLAPSMPQGRDPAGQPLRPRRQGRDQRPGRPGRRPLMARIADAFDRDSRREARPGWWPTSPPAIPISRARPRSWCRSRSNGADVLEVGDPVFRSAGRRPGDPARLGARAGERIDAARRADDDSRTRDRQSPRRSSSSPMPIRSCAWARRRS